MMIGEMEDVYTALHRNGDIEFDYKGVPYMIEPGIDVDKKNILQFGRPIGKKKMYVYTRKKAYVVNM